jgi:hypothetical protein
MAFQKLQVADTIMHYERLWKSSETLGVLLALYSYRTLQDYLVLRIIAFRSPASGNWRGLTNGSRRQQRANRGEFKARQHYYGEERG